jgi:hypothetical protein
MALITRRHFARQMAFAAALCGRPLWAIGESHRFFNADQQSGAPSDPQTIRKLASLPASAEQHSLHRQSRHGPD